jgi:hypothetical protein
VQEGAMLVLLFLAAMSGETTVARIQCPRETEAKVVWPDSISSDPAYSRESAPEEWIKFGFRQISQDGQTITCLYELPIPNQTPGLQKRFRYTVKRTIHGCTKVDPFTLDCTVD